jgi:hypothetical protein
MEAAPIMIRYAILLLALTTTLMTTSCHAMTSTVAERCVLVDLQQARGRELLPLLEQFAQANDLEPELSHPIHPRYIRGAKERSRAEVAYRIGLGEFGAALTLFRFDQMQDTDLPAAFDRFVDLELTPRYKVTRCADIPDFEIPSTYR